MLARSSGAPPRQRLYWLVCTLCLHRGAFSKQRVTWQPVAVIACAAFMMIPWAQKRAGGLFLVISLNTVWDNYLFFHVFLDLIVSYVSWVWDWVVVGGGVLWTNIIPPLRQKLTGVMRDSSHRQLASHRAGCTLTGTKRDGRRRRRRRRVRRRAGEGEWEKVGQFRWQGRKYFGTRGSTEGGLEGGCCEVKVPVRGVRWPPAHGRRTLQSRANTPGEKKGFGGEGRKETRREVAGERRLELL